MSKIIKDAQAAMKCCQARKDELLKEIEELDKILKPEPEITLPLEDVASQYRGKKAAGNKTAKNLLLHPKFPGKSVAEQVAHMIWADSKGKKTYELSDIMLVCHKNGLLIKRHHAANSVKMFECFKRVERGLYKCRKP